MDKKILQPIEIKGMKLKNRIAFAPFFNIPAGENGEVNDLTIRWIEERAKGEVGLIMMGGIGITELPAPVRAQMTAMRGRRGARLWGLGDDRYIPGYARLAEVIHSYGAKLGVQFAAGGTTGGMAPSPPPYPNEKHAKTALMDVASGRSANLSLKEIPVEELERVERDAGAAAARAKAAGIDCVELHSTHGITLHARFISPYFNRRTDKYGGNWERRVRFTGETIRAMKDAVGEDFPVLVRISAEEFIGKWGITIEDTCKFIVPALEKYGVDCFDISQGHIPQSADHIFLPVYFPRGAVIYLAAAVKQATKLPVIGVGKIVDMEMAEKFLEEGKADIIYMGRQLTADPETPKKYFEGRSEDIRKCIGCQTWTNDGGACGRPCSVNYDIQDEPIPLTPAEPPKKVLVIGGGVGGMEAARIAALRGHRVTLMEKDSELGGMVATLAITPLLADFRNIVDYLAVQMRKLKVAVMVCKEATAADIEELKPDVVILATGSSLTLPEVTGGKPGVMTHIEALKRKIEIGQKVVIWGFPGAELAISLAEEGKDVTLMGGGEDSLGQGEITLYRRIWLLRKLTDHDFVRERPEAQRLPNPQVLYNVNVEDITAEGIRIADTGRGERVLPYDTLIISRGRRSNNSLFGELQGKVPEVLKVGDCLRVRDIRRAIWSANEVARKI